MSEATCKSGRKKGYVVLFRDVAQDARLTLEARGLFALMVSLPENWEYTVSGLASKAGCGKDKIRRLLKELQEVGYLIREQSHDAGGKFAANVYILQDEAPLSGNTVNGETRQREKPSTSKPLTDSAALKNKEEKNKEIKDPPKAPQGAANAEKAKRSRKPKAAPDWKPERFEGFWRLYPVKKSKQAAIRAWDSLRPDDKLIAVMGRALQRQMSSPEWRRKIREEAGQGIPYPATWLNGRRWEDEDKPSLPGPAALPAVLKPRPCHTEVIDGEEVLIYDG